MKTIPHCLECGQPLSWGVHIFSQRLYGHSLCIKDQYLMEESGVDARAVDLYLALKARRFPLKLKHFDGFKHVDMAIPGKLYIQLTVSFQHVVNEAMTNLSRTIHALEKKIPTIVISNTLLEYPDTFRHVVDELSKACGMVTAPVNECYVSLAPPLTFAQLQ